MFFNLYSLFNTRLTSKYQNLEPIIRQMRSWHIYKAKPAKAENTNLWNKTLLQCLRQISNTSINEKTENLEFFIKSKKVPWLPINLFLIAFNNIQSSNRIEHIGSEKTYVILYKNFTSQMHPFENKS